MSRFARILALLLVAAAIVLAVLAFSLGRHKTPPPETAQVAATPVTPSPAQPAVASTTATEPVPRGVALQLLPGERALAIPVDEVSGVGNRIVPGDYVDVFFELKKGQDQSGDTQARLLLARMHVLAYGNNVLGAKRPADQDKDKDKEGTTRSEPASPRTAVLAVPVDAVDRLLLASREGKLSLALRHPADESVPDSALFVQPPAVLPTRLGLTPDQQANVAQPDNRAYAGIDVEGLAGRGEPARPVRTQRAERGTPASGGVEIIRGTQRSRLSVTPPCASGKECAP